MNAKRFRNLIQVVEETPESEFDFTRWWCGTRGCAIGHYIRKFPDCGMKIESRRDGSYVINCGVNGLYDTIASHFGIKYGLACDLFVTNMHVMTKEKMLTRLRELYEKNNEHKR